MRPAPSCSDQCAWQLASMQHSNEASSGCCMPADCQAYLSPHLDASLTRRCLPGS